MRIDLTRFVPVLVAIGIAMLVVVRCNSACEGWIRLTIGPAGLMGSILLCILAWRSWHLSDRERLSGLRNGMGCASMAVTSCQGILQMLSTIALFVRPGYFSVGIDISLIYPRLPLLAIVVGSALNGNARIYAISSAVMLWSATQAAIYFMSGGA